MRFGLLPVSIRLASLGEGGNLPLVQSRSRVTATNLWELRGNPI